MSPLREAKDTEKFMNSWKHILHQYSQSGTRALHGTRPSQPPLCQWHFKLVETRFLKKRAQEQRTKGGMWAFQVPDNVALETSELKKEAEN